jgi:hypothetical protein
MVYKILSNNFIISESSIKNYIKQSQWILLNQNKYKLEDTHSLLQSSNVMWTQACNTYYRALVIKELGTDSIKKMMTEVLQQHSLTS